MDVTRLKQAKLHILCLDLLCIVCRRIRETVSQAFASRVCDQIPESTFHAESNCNCRGCWMHCRRSARIKQNQLGVD